MDQEFSRGKYSKRKNGGQAGRRLCGIVACCWFLGGCAAFGPPARTSQSDPYQQFGQWYKPITDSTGFVETGVASWYGNDFHGKRTSSGEVYDMHGLTAAHKTLPLGTYVKVINLKNGRSVIVRINDRGPFVEGRIIDLSHLAAGRIGIATAGTGRVAIVALDEAYRETLSDKNDVTASLTDRSAQNAFSLQAASFTSLQKAESFKAELGQKYDKAHIEVFDEGPQTFYRVRVGEYVTREEAELVLRKMKVDGYENTVVVTE